MGGNTTLRPFALQAFQLNPTQKPLQLSPQAGFFGADKSARNLAFVFHGARFAQGRSIMNKQEKNI
jgi:hypothetical protein